MDAADWIREFKAAIRADDEARMRRLLAERPAAVALDHPGRGGQTFLMLAAARGRVAAMELLLAAGCDLLRRDRAGRSAQNFGEAGNYLKKSKERAGLALIDAYDDGRAPAPAAHAVSLSHPEGVPDITLADYQEQAADAVLRTAGLHVEWKAMGDGLVWLRPDEESRVRNVFDALSDALSAAGGPRFELTARDDGQRTGAARR